jgi:hypothetical protein
VKHPFEDTDNGRRWLVINSAERPSHGEQFIRLTSGEFAPKRGTCRAPV